MYEAPLIAIPNPIPQPLTGSTSPMLILPVQNAAGAWLRAAIANAAAGAVINLPPGFVQLGKDPIQHTKPVTIKGAGQGRTYVTTSNANFGGINPGIGLADGVAYEDMTLELTIGKTLEGELIGFGQAAPGNSTAYLRRLNLRACGWTAYIWSAPGNKLVIEDCHLWGAHRAVACQTSSGPDAAAIDLHRTWLHIDPSLTTAGGAVGPNAIGIVSGAGRVRMFQGGIDGTGGPGNDFIAGAWNDTGGEPSALIELHDVCCRINQGQAKAAYDTFTQKGTIRTFGGSGSGKDGAWVKQAN